MTLKILYIIILIFVGAVVLLAFEVVVQHQENKNLLGRRNGTDKPVPPAEENHCSRQCALYCTFEDTVIPELKNENEAWAAAYNRAMQKYEDVRQKHISAEKQNEILQSTIAKLRTSKEDKQ